MKGVLFDLDGTLWDSAAGVSRAWNEVLAEHGFQRRVDVPMMHGMMGKQMDEIAALLFPGCTGDERTALMAECCAREHEVLARRGGELFPKLEETLQELKARYFLAIISNCQCGYIETFLEYYDLGKYFDDTECFGATGLSKGRNIAALMRRNALDAAVYVGDTQGDLDAANEAGAEFIHAGYGFGKTPEASHEIKGLDELPELLKKIGF